MPSRKKGNGKKQRKRGGGRATTSPVVTQTTVSSLSPSMTAGTMVTKNFPAVNLLTDFVGRGAIFLGASIEMLPGGSDVTAGSVFPTVMAQVTWGTTDGGTTATQQFRLLSKVNKTTFAVRPMAGAQQTVSTDTSTLGTLSVKVTSVTAGALGTSPDVGQTVGLVIRSRWRLTVDSTPNVIP